MTLKTSWFFKFSRLLYIVLITLTLMNSIFRCGRHYTFYVITLELGKKL